MVCDEQLKQPARKDYGRRKSRSFCKPRDNQPPMDGDLWKKVSPVALDEELPVAFEAEVEEPEDVAFPSASSAYIWISSRWRFVKDLSILSAMRISSLFQARLPWHCYSKPNKQVS